MLEHNKLLLRIALPQIDDDRHLFLQGASCLQYMLYDIILQVFVNEGNIYYQPNPGAKAERITNGGGDYRLYGISDWLYEGTSYHS